MELINYTYNLKKTKEWQPVVSFSASKNSFIIECKLKSKAEVKSEDDRKPQILEEDHYTFLNAFFRMHYVNNDLNYNILDGVKFDPTGNSDPLGKPSFFICLKIDNKPDFEEEDVSFKPFVIKPGDEFRFHLDYTDNCSAGPVNSGDFPCNIVTAS